MVSSLKIATIAFRKAPEIALMYSQVDGILLSAVSNQPDSWLHSFEITLPNHRGCKLEHLVNHIAHSPHLNRPKSFYNDTDKTQ